jgi:glycosyltransferase involved in cell wall biosynthesis
VKLLILSQYYPPEVGAPQNRLHELALHLQELGVDVTVLTAMPNYPSMRIQKNYAGKKYFFEEIDGVKVHRSSIYVSQDRSILSRLRNYFSFVWSSALTGNKKLGNFDFLLCESPPLFLGYSAMYLSRKKKARLIFNVSDLWPESAEKLGVVNNKTVLGFAYRLEERLYKRSALVTGQTQGICADIKKRFPSVPVYWLPNGVDLSFYDPAVKKQSDWREKHNIADADKVFLYAGIIGIAQGLEIIVNCAVHFLTERDVKFVLMGSGPEKERLQKLAKTKGAHNVIFTDPVPKSEMPGIVSGAYAAIIPLRKLDIFRGAIPSKIFENLAMEIPVLLGVEGEAKELFIDQGKCGLFFEPENVDSLLASIREVLLDQPLRNELGKNGRLFVSRYFDRTRIASHFFARLQQLFSE